jgi:DNA polymerase I
MPRLFVLDAMGLAYRAHYAFIRRPLVNSRGENTSALFGFANSVLKVRREESPDYWALAWESRGPTHRHALFPAYKATRKPMPEELLAQIPAIADVSRALGLPVIEMPGVEADDVMATLAVCAERDGFEVVLVTSDKDLVQLVDDRVRLLSPSGRGEEYLWVDRAAVHEKWGVAPEQTRDILALMGDSTDNVPGVPGVGPKTATELIQEFGSLDGIYANLERVTKDGLREKLRANREQAFLSRELVTVKTDCDLGLDWEALRRGPIQSEALHAIAERYELQKLKDLARNPEPASSPAVAAPTSRAEARAEPVEVPTLALETAVPFRPLTEFAQRPEPTRRLEPAQGSLDLWSATPVTTGSGGGLEAQRERIHEVRSRAIHGLALMPLISGADPRVSRLIGIALAARDGSTCYVPIGHEQGPNFTLDEVHGWFTLAFADASVPKISEDLKRDAHVLANAGMPIAGLAFDLHIGSFLCDPDRGHSLAAIARDFAGIDLPGLDDALAGRAGRTRPGAAALDPGMVAGALEPAVATLFPLAETLRGQLAAREQLALYDDIEHSLIAVLTDMERAGIRLDVAALAAQSARVAADLRRLEEELYVLAGERFNLMSGPQLTRILFEVLKLEPGRRTKTGWSTDQVVLEELAAAHPFPARLLEYRTLAKLASTYLDALPLAVDARDGRVHTTFNPVGAATGRLSSSNPNLQNIPIRTPQGREIRRAFIAAPGSVLVGADYSQIELRIMAHLSGDPNLIAAFEAGEDVHANTARRIFGISGELDPAIRARAKIVNFGIMYGMGARSLSQQMKIPLTEAQDFIRGYFRVFAGVREYLDRQVEEARRRGYIQTVFGRRRYLPALMGPPSAQRALAERVAINAPIQGSAADLMKLAMIRVHRALKSMHPSARLLLQVHDELLIECPAEVSDAVAERVRAEMEGGHPLRVPLSVSVGRGATWFDVH